MSFHDYKISTLEPMAEMWIGDHRVERLTPVLMGSIVCGITWGVLGLQFLAWCIRSTKSQHWGQSTLICYLMLASTAYLGLYSTYMSYFFAYYFGKYAAVFDLTYTSWLYLLATVFIHIPCEMYYVYSAYKLSGRNRLVGFILTGMCAGIVGLGVAVKVITPNFLTSITSLQSFLIKFWIALCTATDLAVAAVIMFYLSRDAPMRFSSARGLKKFFMLLSEAQIPPTLLSIGLLVLLMVKPSSSLTQLWLGFPLVFPVTLLSTVATRQAHREDIEAEVTGPVDRRESEKTVTLEIPEAQHRPSFTFSPFPAMRRASQELSLWATTVAIPAMNGVRRASNFFGVLPPLPKSHVKEKKAFPFKKKNHAPEMNEPREYHPTSLAYPLKDDAAPMGMSHLPAAVTLERAHSLAPLDEEPHLSVAFGQSTAHPLTPLEEDRMSPNNLNGPALVDPFSGSPSVRRSPSPSFNGAKPPSLAEALVAHEIFEMPSTPEMLSPRSGHSSVIDDESGTERGDRW